MLYCYCGKVGDGKTYHVIKHEILPALVAGRKVYHNIDRLSYESVARYFLYLAARSFFRRRRVEPPSRSLFRKFKNKNEIKTLFHIPPCDDEEHIPLSACLLTPGSLVIIDEAQMIWDNSLHGRAKKGTLSLLEYHRHFGLDVVLITQNVSRMDKEITALVNEFYEIRNLKYTTFGLSKTRYRKRVYLTYPFFESVSTTFENYDLDIFRTYRSEFMNQAPRSYAMSFVLKAGILLVLGLLVLFFLTMKDNLYVKGLLKAPPPKPLYERAGGVGSKISGGDKPHEILDPKRPLPVPLNK